MTARAATMTHPPRHSAGLTLIEVLVSLIVIAVGLLGLAALQGKAQRVELESYQRSQALILLHDMTARFRANRPGRASYLGETGYGSSFTDTTSCANSGQPIATQDLSCWHNALLGAAETLANTNVGGLIGGHGCITGTDPSYLVTVAWQGLGPSTLGANDSRATNTCGQGLYGGNDNLRRIVSLPVFFYDER